MLWKRHRLVGLVVVNRKNKGKMPKNCRVEQRNEIAQQECSSLEGGGGRRLFHQASNLQFWAACMRDRSRQQVKWLSVDGSEFAQFEDE